ncbi:hypothetical protein A0H76_1423 [Hepatospora eriocheir]|uniref:Uncharacterized protein n=1 Tax=Hepatospora eriocheir TaxID=1081669 RepID=A0A1X0Q5T7_9MICR|nr:hypothetical protein A0H76_1423 [Hepatospora eriocheir]
MLSFLLKLISSLEADNQEQDKNNQEQDNLKNNLLGFSYYRSKTTKSSPTYTIYTYRKPYSSGGYTYSRTSSSSSSSKNRSYSGNANSYLKDQEINN